MTTRSNQLLPDELSAAWLRELRRGPFQIMPKTVRLFDRATRLIAAEMAILLMPSSERLADGKIRLRVPIGPGFKDSTIKPEQANWLVELDPRSGNWDGPGAAPWESGIASLAAHVWRIMGRSDTGTFDPRSRLLMSLGRVLLAVLATERNRSLSFWPAALEQIR